MLILGAVLFIALVACWFALPVGAETSSASQKEEVKA
jgi:hypothetical protein